MLGNFELHSNEMKLRYFFLFFGLLISCSSNRKTDQNCNLNLRKYEVAYISLTKEYSDSKPFLEEYHSDASGIKLIPRIFTLKNYSLYSGEIFKHENSYANNDITKLSKKYTNPKWRRDSEFRILLKDEMKNFHGPLKYLYFSEIKNDSLRADVISNPHLRYSMTTAERYLIIFEKDSIKSVQKTISNYD